MTSLAQYFSGSLGAGYGSYSMNSLRLFGKQIVEQTLPGIEVQTLHDYPNYFYYMLQVDYTNKKSTYGLYAVHGSTGSRLYHGDYSGTYRLDNLVSYSSIGLHVGEEFAKWGSVTLSGNVRITANFNAVDYIERIEVFGVAAEEKTGFRSLNAGIQPYISLKRTFQRLTASIEGGYEYQIPGKLFFNDRKEIFLLNNSGSPVVVNGFGFRFSAAIGWIFNARLGEGPAPTRYKKSKK